MGERAVWSARGGRVPRSTWWWSLGLASGMGCALGVGEETAPTPAPPAALSPTGVYAARLHVQGSVDVQTGSISLRRVEPGEDETGSTTAALTEITVDADGVPGSASTTDVVELVTIESSSATVTPQGCPGTFPTTFCGIVDLRSFYDTSFLGDAFLEFTSITAGVRLSNGVPKAPGGSSLRFVPGLVRYGVLEPSVGYDYEVSRRLWIFSVPVGVTRFSFDAVVWANVMAAPPNLLASVSSTGNNPPNANFASGTISEDGRYVVFSSTQSLASPDTGFNRDVYRYDRTTGAVVLVSVNSAGTAGGNNESYEPVVSDDGNLVFFTSRASNLIASDPNGSIRDVYMRNMTTGVTTAVSLRHNGEHSRRGTRGSENPAISGDGCWIAFQSDMNNLVASPTDTNGTTDVFLRRRCTSPTTFMMSLKDDDTVLPSGRFGINPSVSDDGCRVTWETNNSTKGITGLADKTVPAAASDIILRDRCTGTSTLVSVRPDGLASGNRVSTNASISEDGELVVFESESSDLTATDPNGTTRDIFLRDVGAATTVRIGGNGASFEPRISRPGTFVAFVSDATDLVAGDTNGLRDAFVYEVGTASIQRINLNGTAEATGGSTVAAQVSALGTYTLIETNATNLYDFDDNSGLDILVRPLN